MDVGDEKTADLECSTKSIKMLAIATEDLKKKKK